VRYNDTVVLRGMDTYRNLPNKTLRLMRYVLAHPAGACRALRCQCRCMCSCMRTTTALPCMRLARHTGSKKGGIIVPAQHCFCCTVQATRMSLRQMTTAT
jgi:hypothetical protein